MQSSRLKICIGLLFSILLAETSTGQEHAPLPSVYISGRFAGSGLVEDIQPGQITLLSQGRRKSFAIQNKDERFLSLDGNDLIISMPAEIRVQGWLPGRLLEPGMIVSVQTEINRAGRTGTPVQEFQVIQGDQESLKILPAQEPRDKTFVPCTIVGIVQSVANQTVYLVVPRSTWTPNQRIKFKMAEEAKFSIQAHDLNRVRSGDLVSEFKGEILSNGLMVIREIAVELSEQRPMATPSYSDQLYQKYSYLSDDPVEPREERSPHFVIQTDISPREAQVLLAKLENMYGFLSRYFHRRIDQPIECIVVQDVELFRTRLPSLALQKIEARSGITIAEPSSNFNQNRQTAIPRKSLVYSCDDQAIVQHEVVHAYCLLAFGSLGPVWYAEGMAEIGQYYVPQQKAVRIDPVVIEYLSTARQKSMADIMADGQVTGDSWKAYAWRWALCHLLSHHPSYSQRFRLAGPHLLGNKQDAFDKALGKSAQRLAFEYQQFVAHLDNGYRVDLCAWQWNDETVDVESSVEFAVQARGGWQSTGFQLREDQAYDFVCPAVNDDQGNRIKQTWSVHPAQRPVSAEGNARGDGMLMGVIQFGFELSDPFEIGIKHLGFRAPVTGQLYVRCQDAWNALDDNSGQLHVIIRPTPTTVPETDGQRTDR